MEENKFTLLCLGEEAPAGEHDHPGVLWVTALMGQMIVSMNVTPLEAGASIKAGPVALELSLMNGSSLHLESGQAESFLLQLGMRVPLIESATTLPPKLRN